MVYIVVGLYWVVFSLSEKIHENGKWSAGGNRSLNNAQYRERYQKINAVRSHVFGSQTRWNRAGSRAQVRGRPFHVVGSRAELLSEHPFSSPDTTFWAKRETWYFCSKAYHAHNLDKTMGYFVTRWWQDGTNRSSPFQHLNQSKPNPSVGFVARHVSQVPFRNRDGVCLWLRILCLGCLIVLTTVAFKIFFEGGYSLSHFKKNIHTNQWCWRTVWCRIQKKHTTQTPITSSETFGQIIGGRIGRWSMASCTLATRSLGRIPVVEKGPPSITRRMSKPVFPGAGTETLGQVKKNTQQYIPQLCLWLRKS